MQPVQLLVTLIAMLTVQVSAIIPAPCATVDNLARGECCPVPDLPGAGPCGANLVPSRGVCKDIEFHYNPNTTYSDVRYDWPLLYFNRTCDCGERYGGVDCGECSFAYNDGADCAEKTVIPRKAVSELSDDEWVDYRYALRKIKDQPSRYKVANVKFPKANEDMTREDRAPLIVDTLVDVTTYDLFVWIHHFVAKDNVATLDSHDAFTDFAHEGPGFPTWHRLFLLWLEREIQVAINNHTFRLPFWDWSNPSQREYLFDETRLGENIGGEVRDDGYLFENWTTRCWSREDPQSDEFRQICDPTKDSNRPLRRCPNPESCAMSNHNWPSEEDVKCALSIKSYDASPYNRYVLEKSKSFRNFMEGFIVGCDENSDYLCSGNRPVTRKLHNTVHIILGVGDVKNAKKYDLGVMSCVAASPNDPIFINHHANIDCILEGWLQENVANYPTANNIRHGHRKDDYIVPFIPLYMHNDMFKTADNFGYNCPTLQPSPCPSPPPNPSQSPSPSPSDNPTQTTNESATTVLIQDMTSIIIGVILATIFLL